MENEKKALNIGDSVVYTDEHRRPHAALVTSVWNSVGNLPGCNVVFVVDDESKGDNYGRQIERATSVIHRSVQPAGGRCWHWKDEG